MLVQSVIFDPCEGHYCRDRPFKSALSIVNLILLLECLKAIVDPTANHCMMLLPCKINTGFDAIEYRPVIYGH